MTLHFPAERDFVRWNEEMTRKYDSEDFHLRSSFLIRWVERRRVEVILDLLGSTSHDMLLEVGCGTGVVLKQLPASSKVGVDISRFALEKASRRLASSNTVLVQANGELLPIRNGCLRKIVCTEVIEHVVSPSVLARELARVATFDATIVLTVPNEALIERVKTLIACLGLGRWLLRGIERSRGRAYEATAGTNEWHLHRFNLTSLQRVTRDHLVLDRVKAVPFSLLPLRYVARFRVRPGALNRTDERVTENHR